MATKKKKTVKDPLQGISALNMPIATTGKTTPQIVAPPFEYPESEYKGVYRAPQVISGYVTSAGATSRHEFIQLGVVNKDSILTQFSLVASRRGGVCATAPHFRIEIRREGATTAVFVAALNICQGATDAADHCEGSPNCVLYAGDVVYLRYDYDTDAGNIWSAVGGYVTVQPFR